VNKFFEWRGQARKELDWGYHFWKRGIPRRRWRDPTRLECSAQGSDDAVEAAFEREVQGGRAAHVSGEGIGAGLE
jgi:hypothetical protein